MDETFAAYLPKIHQNWLDECDSWETHRQTAWVEARKIAERLRTQFGAQQVFVFGSLRHTGPFDTKSDIDIAVRGIPAAQFYRAVADCMAMSQSFSVDLVDLDTCPESLRQTILREGKPL